MYVIAIRIRRSLKVDNFAEKYVFITGCDTGFGRELAMYVFQFSHSFHEHLHANIQLPTATILPTKCEFLLKMQKFNIAKYF